MGTKQTTCFMFVACVSLSLAGCERHNWSSYGHDSARRAYQPDEDKLNTTTVKTLNFTTTGWMFQSPGGSFVASPAVFDETVYIGDGLKVSSTLCMPVDRTRARCGGGIHRRPDRFRRTLAARLPHRCSFLPEAGTLPGRESPRVQRWWSTSRVTRQ
jgi:hypothetical protein